MAISTAPHLGETNDGALIGGYRFNMQVVEILLGVFNGKTKTGDKIDIMDNIVVSIIVNPTEFLKVGVSYTTNLAAADAFSEFIQGDLANYVGGWSSFLSASILNRFIITGEFVSAVDHFMAGQIYSADDPKGRKPQAWNIEISTAISKNLELAARFEGSIDGGSSATGDYLLPESQFGTVLNMSIFGGNLALEYMNGWLENKDQINSMTVQYAIEF